MFLGYNQEDFFKIDNCRKLTQKKNLQKPKFEKQKYNLHEDEHFNFWMINSRRILKRIKISMDMSISEKIKFVQYEGHFFESKIVEKKIRQNIFGQHKEDFLNRKLQTKKCDEILFGWHQQEFFKPNIVEK